MRIDWPISRLVVLASLNTWMLASAATACPLAAGDSGTPAADPRIVRVAQARPAPTQATQPAAATTPEKKKLDDTERVMEFFRQTQPDVYEQATSLRSSDPTRFDKLITGAIPTVNRLEAIRKKDPRLFELSMKDLQLGYQSLRISHDLKRPGLMDAERRRLTDQLKVIVAEEFEVQQEIRRIELEELQKKVKELADQVKDRESDKVAIIQKRIGDLIERSARLEW